MKRLLSLLFLTSLICIYLFPPVKAQALCRERFARVKERDSGVSPLLILPEELSDEERAKRIPPLLILEEENSTEEIEATEEAIVETTEAIYVEETIEETVEEMVEEMVEEVTEETVMPYTDTSRGHLTARKGYITDGPAGDPNAEDAGHNGYETWYDLDMTEVVRIMDELMKKKGEEDGCIYNYEYWVREDGCKMYGPYIMVAGDIVNTRQRGDIIETSLGTAMVCDYCELAVKYRPYHIDIATDWAHTYSRRD